MRRAVWIAVSAAWLCSGVLAAEGDDTPRRSVVIFTPAADDLRLDAAREAIAFWNSTLSDLGRPTPFSDAEIVVHSPVTHVLETYAKHISQFGYQRLPYDPGPRPPHELMDLSGDVILLLSTQRILSFSWPIDDRDRYFVSIQTDVVGPLTNSAVSRNVIAHEMGHTFGLVHNREGKTLMCRRCDLKPLDAPFLPLTRSDRDRLLGSSTH